MGKIYSIDDVEDSVNEREREKFKKKTVEDISDIFEGIFPKKEKEKIERKFSLFKWLGIFLLSLFGLTLILGCVFLLRFFIRGIF